MDHRQPRMRSATVWLMFRQHAWESGSSWTGDAAVRALLHDPNLRDRHPSGTFSRWPIRTAWHTEASASTVNGYDLNRNWDVYRRPSGCPRSPRSERRSWTGCAAGNSIDLFFTAAQYGDRRVPRRIRRDRSPRRFFKALKEQHYFRSDTRPCPPVVPNIANREGRTWCRRSAPQKIPAFLMEQRIAYNGKLGHLAEIPDRISFGRELVQAIYTVVVQSR